MGNPAILFSGGIDYNGETGVPAMSPTCRMVDTLQLVLEITINGTPEDGSGDAIGQTTPTGAPAALLQTIWTSANPALISVSADGLLTAVGENGCTTINATIADITPGPPVPPEIIVSPTCTSPGVTIAACVDTAGVDTATRGVWCPAGDLDGVYATLPSGHGTSFGAIGVGGNFSATFVAMIPLIEGMTPGLAPCSMGFPPISSSWAAFTFRTEYNEAFIDENQAIDGFSIGGSTDSMTGNPGPNPSVANRTRLNKFLTTGAPVPMTPSIGLFDAYDLFTQTWTVTGAGTSDIDFFVESLATGCFAPYADTWNAAMMMRTTMGVGDPCLPPEDNTALVPGPSGTIGRWVLPASITLTF
jgi:hypothetical protein